MIHKFILPSFYYPLARALSENPFKLFGFWVFRIKSDALAFECIQHMVYETRHEKIGTLLAGLLRYGD